MKGYLLVILVVLGISACSDRSFTFEIPNGYTGWVTVRFGEKNCGDTSIPSRTVVRVRADGTACTSVAAYPKTAWLSEFYYVAGDRRISELKPTAWGQGGMIWAESTEMDGREYRFFVGEEAELEKSYKVRAAAANTT